MTGYGGTYRGNVVDDADPMQRQRLLVVVPEVYGDASAWAEASLPAGATGPLPGIGDLVWISFNYGDADYPVWATDRGADHDNRATAGYIGKYRGVVVDNDDPMQRHRLEVRVPDVDPSPAWATPPVDHLDDIDLPVIGSEVWVEYDNGDPAYPRWVGVA